MKTKTEKTLPKILRGSVHQQFKKCGKMNCRCAVGKLHGAYYYHFVRVGGKLKKRYLKPTEVEPTLLACLERQRLEKLRRCNTRDDWKKIRELRIEIRQSRNFIS
ncbi:MAG: hypothetical protein M3Q99_19065 [Acidobacteriota bacterium]|nr:hypothetical protein [Acidobacteriota bacterium]